MGVVVRVCNANNRDTDLQGHHEGELDDHVLRDEADELLCGGLELRIDECIVP